MEERIVLNTKFKKHMQTHSISFYENYENYLTEDIKEKILKKCNSNFNIINLKMPFTVGVTNIAPVNKNDKIFWAKRKERNIYSRFVQNKKSKETNIITFIIKQQYYNKNLFNLISMYPSLGETQKEIFDPNIASLEELEQCISFWTKFAFADKEYIPGTENSILEKNNVLFNKEFWDSTEQEIMQIHNTQNDKLYLKNLYFGSKTLKWFDEFGQSVLTQCKYTGLKFNFLTKDKYFVIGYAGNEKNDFIESIYIC
ncbi:hypothetical protein KM792_10215 [Clostridium tyrobutyricum]|uniref:hypothetical protein n=1 Tax=Clostridium tyrobutyricum TaxID=1519 RepID=UPI001C385A4C|nr:hypothetical protein [Clostridium tyrobutyricum]MBV4428721.1 hypothetical protein [Clostridium tyrobutyricum]MBV4443862.1 hypothetical protein [Clostridium tyrobutyricum]MBV4450026.1 hypothetical protein [Clostridium tyrobutyricum]